MLPKLEPHDALRRADGGVVDKVACVFTRYSKCPASGLVRGNEQGIRTV